MLPSSLLEQVKKNAADHAIVKEILTEYELIVDTYEQVRERPGTRDEKEKYFSGKKSNHTFKSQIIIMPDGRDIVDVVAGEPGSKSDITLFREYRSEFAPQQRFKGDKAYVAILRTVLLQGYSASRAKSHWNFNQKDKKKALFALSSKTDELKKIPDEYS